MTVCQKSHHAELFELCTAAWPPSPAGYDSSPRKNQNRPTYISRLVLCQRDGKMESVLDNGHFVRSKFGRDAGFWLLLIKIKNTQFCLHNEPAVSL